MNAALRSSAIALLFAVACTPGGAMPSNSAGITPQHIVDVDINLAAFGLVQLPAGTARGYSPETVSVRVGDGVRFVNTDNTQHTASFVAGTTFPSSSPLQFAATSPSGGTGISSPDWSSGSLAPGTTSQTFVVDKPGVYLYGCFYHYSGGMRGQIVAQ